MPNESGVPRSHIINLISNQGFHSPYEEFTYSCRFFKINDQFGAKVYVDKKKFENQYNLQQKAFALGLAPEAYESFTVKHKRKNYYVFVTELVEVLGDRLTAIYTDEVYTSWCPYYSMLYEEYDLIKLKHYEHFLSDNIDHEQIVKLKKELKPVFDWIDDTAWNIGIKNGRYICIDFDF